MVLHRNRLFEVLFVLALATKPLYFLKSGNIQISDVFFLLTVLVVCSSEKKIKIDKSDYSFLKVFLLIIVYQVVMNLIGPLIWNPTGKYELLIKPNLYYVFNFIVVYCIFTIVRIVGFSRTTELYMLGTVLSVILSLVGVFVENSGSRASSFFNNPNQLGYFCVVTLTAVILFRHNLSVGVRVFCLIACSYMSILSLSKAAILALAVMYFFFANDYERKTDVKKVIITLLGMGIALLAVYLLLYSDIPLISNYSPIEAVRNRMLNMMQENDSDIATGRGYGRITEIGGCLLCGVGEGMNERFTILKGFETHSTYASIIVSYGIIGFVLYCFLIRKAIRSKVYGLRYTIIFLGIIVYSTTHNGIRSTLLWALIAMSYSKISASSSRSYSGIRVEKQEST